MSKDKNKEPKEKPEKKEPKGKVKGEMPLNKIPGKYLKFNETEKKES